MSKKILILAEQVANQIAAGEVIERPASVVKELVENSIDAGSTRIQVEITEGGKNAIRILDNGEGISREDVITAFERHATSKIREASDLFSIRTLGFRGEALPSIAAISKLTVQTRTKEDTLGTLLKIEGGEVKEHREVGMAIGTDFLIEDLFYNTPARLKYLRTATTELGLISDIFNRIAVAKPQIAMTLSHNGRLLNRTPGTGQLTDVILSIYGRELMENLLPVDYEDNYVKVTGYVTGPAIYRSSRKHQSYYVNGRYVRSTLIGQCITEAYANLLPASRNPLVFLFININPIHVDVNVHPAKLEVKFSRPEIVTDVILRGIRQALLQENKLPTFHPMEKNLKRVSDEPVHELQALFAEENTQTIPVSASPDLRVDEIKPENENTGKENNLVAKRLRKLGYQPKNWDPLYQNGESTFLKSRTQKYEPIAKDNDDNLENTLIKTPAPVGPGAFIATLLPIGQVHKTYIIAQGKDGFYVIDQHVAHERVLYEELMSTFRTKGLPSQTLLIPLTLELTVKEVQVIEANDTLFNQLGFEVEHFGGNTIIVRAVPRRIDRRPDKDLFLEIVDLLIEEKKAGDRARLYNNLITSMSCKGAIKAGEHLEQGEMLKLLEDLSKTENPRFCPHGRPILFHISEEDLLRAFKRI